MLRADYEIRCARAVDIALRVGREALQFRESADPSDLNVTSKGLQDYVTVADRKAEDTIKSALGDAFPEDGFLGEETGGAPATNGYWVVDPIDGTSNYVRGLRHWGVSIAYVLNDKIQIGVIYDAEFDRVYSAIAGQGAYCGDRKVKVSAVSDTSQALLIVGYSHRTDFNIYQTLTRKLVETGADYRRLGAAAIGLVRVADGHADLYFESHVNSWDIFAGVLIAHEAGAKVQMIPAGEMITTGGPVIATTPGLDGEFAFLTEAVGENCVVLQLDEVD